MSTGGGDNEIKETSQEKELARIATEQWDRYETTFRPLEDRWIADITNSTLPDKADVGGVVAGKIGSQYDAAQADIDRKQLARGTNVDSGTFKRGLSRAEDTGKALSRANVGVDANQTAQIFNAIKVGRGQSADAQRSMSDVASKALSDTIKDSRNAYIRDQETGAAISTVAGAGTRTLLGDDEK